METNFTVIQAPQKSHKYQNHEILGTIHARSNRLHSNTISRIAQYFEYASINAKLLDIADALQDRPNLPAIAIVNDEQKVEGIIERETLFSIISKPFGREVMRRTIAKEFMEKALCIDYRMDIFSAAECVQKSAINTNEFFVLVDESSA